MYRRVSTLSPLPDSDRTTFWTTCIANAAILLALLCSPASAGMTFAPLVILAHTSDPSAGASKEVTQDFLGAGVEVKAGSFRVEFAVGRKATNCNLSASCRSTLGGYAALKWSPSR
jgi:hypothetical protein